MNHSHRSSSSLKQSNKSHKGSGGARRAKGSGRVERKALKVGVASASTSAGASLGGARAARVNIAKQLRSRKREETWLLKRTAGGGGYGAPPRVAAWVPLSALADCAAIQKSLIEAGDVHAGLPGGVSTVLFRAQKQRMTFIPPPVGAERNLMSVLELARMADMLLVVLPLNGGIESAVDAEGELMLTALKCQGLPCVVGVMQGLGALPGKKEKEGRSWGQRFFASEFADAAKVADARSETQLLRAITSASPRPLHWRSMRSYIVSEQVDISDDAGGASATLKVRGYVRGRPLNPDNLVHVSDVGACRLLRACKVSQPCPTRQSDECADPDPLVEGDSSRQEDLDFEAEPDPLAGEQTWPTEDELLNAASRSDLKDGEPSAQRRPGGWSTYQSAWLLDDTNDDGAASDGEKQDLDTILAGGAREEDEEEAGEQAQDEPWFDDGEGSDDDADMMDDAESSRLKREAEAEDREFPDEVETPNGMTARRRFARFRALKSFRSSPWDAKESLPRDYGRIYQFDDFGAIQGAVMKEGDAAEEAQKAHLISAREGCASRSVSASSNAMDVGDGSTPSAYAGHSLVRLGSGRQLVTSGTYIELELQLSAEQATLARARLTRDSLPMSMFSLLRFENKLSVLHFNVQRDPRVEEAVPSKSRLHILCGFRRWDARPLFSQINLNCDKHKFERFLQPSRFCGASVYGPATFQPAPVLILRELEGGGDGRPRMELVASGTLSSVDPDRIMLKKVLLTGHPIRVRKRKAVVKHMFRCSGDVMWFKPAELTTKTGLVGHIREAVGTHGLMKVVFNQHVKQNDTVCLSLYKRVYPKLLNDACHVL